MDLPTLKSLQSMVNDDGLTKAMAHPEWAASYADTLENIDLPFREKDADDEVTLAYVLTTFSFGVDEKNRIYCDTQKIGTDGYTWTGEDWMDTAMIDEDEES